MTDTLLTPPDFVNHNEGQCILNVALAEGNKPLTEFKDEFSEELAYPGKIAQSKFFIVTFVNQN